MSAPYKLLSAAPGDFAEWQRHFDRLDAACVYALPAYIRFLANHYRDAAKLFVYEEDGAFVYFAHFRRELAPLSADFDVPLEGRCHLYSSWYYGGPLAQPAAPDARFRQRFYTAWLQYARDCGAVTEFTRCDANLGNHALFPPAETQFERETVFVDLTQERAAIWRDFNQSNRWAVNRARRDGVEVAVRTADDADCWQAFAAIYHDEMVRKNAPAHLYFDVDYFERLRTELRDHVCLVTTSLRKEMCGGVILLFGGAHCFGFLSATRPQFWRSQVNNLGWTEAIWWAKAHGYAVFDLMGGRPGVFQYKAHFSSARSRFHVRKAIYDHALYERLLAARSRGADIEGRPFPAYL